MNILLKKFIAFIDLFEFIFSITHTRKGHESQIYLSGISYYTFVSSTIYVGKYKDNLRHLMMKMRR